MVKIHSTICVLFIASLAVLSAGVSVDFLNSKRTMARVANNIIRVTADLEGWNNAIQVYFNKNETNFGDDFVIHYRATDLTCSMNQVSTEIWATAIEEDSDARTIIDGVVPMRFIFKQALGTLVNGSYHNPFTHDAACIIREDLVNLNISSWQFMFGVFSSVPDDMKLEVTAVSDDLYDFFNKALAAYADPTSTILEGR